MTGGQRLSQALADLLASAGHTSLGSDVAAIAAGPVVQQAVQATERLFQQVTTLSRGPALDRFLSNWGVAHNSSGSVAGLVVRVLREAARPEQPAARDSWHRLAQLLAEIHEDWPLQTIPFLNLKLRSQQQQQNENSKTSEIYRRKVA